MTLKMNLPLKVKLKVILLTLLNMHLNNNIRSVLIQIFKHYCLKKQLIRMPQNMHCWLMKQPPHQVRNMLLHPQKYLKSKKYLGKGQKAATNLVVNQNATKHALLADETTTRSGEEHVALPPKVSKVKEMSAKGKKAAPKLVAKKSVIPQKASALPDEGTMALDSDLDGEDDYIVEDTNESASFEYVPCINYLNDKVHPKDEKNGWVRLEEDTGPPNIYRFEGSC